MSEFFTRQIQLWGEERQKSLASKSIAILGCGGLGGTLALTLGASGIGNIHLVDFDRVSLHNIHRQLLFRMEDEGRAKCERAAELVRSRYDKVNVMPHDMKLQEFFTLGIKVDLLLDATDNLPSRAAIDEYAKNSGTPWIYASVEAWHGQVCFMQKALFKQAFAVTDRKPEGIAPPIVALLSSLQANIALRYLVGEPIESDMLHYLSFDQSGAFKLQKFGMPKE